MDGRHDPFTVVKNGYALFWQGVFSNFHPCRILDEENTFRSSEQMFMYGKAVLFNDDRSADMILKAATPKETKALGRKVSNFDSKVWDKYKFQIMKFAVMEKFSQNHELAKELLSSRYDGVHFVEASPFDRIWGIGYGIEDAFKVGTQKWGENLLGRVLDEVRLELPEKLGERKHGGWDGHH